MARTGTTAVKGNGVHLRMVTAKVAYNGTLSTVTARGSGVASATRASQGVHTVTFRDKGLRVVGVGSALGLSAAIAGAAVTVQIDNEGSATLPLSVKVLTHCAASASFDPAADADNWFSVNLMVEESSAAV